MKQGERFRENDSVSDDERKSFEKYWPQQRQNWVRLMLNASRKTQEPAVAQSLKAEIEVTLPSEKEQQSAYWWNRAALAAAESRKADALTFYQSALLALNSGGEEQTCRVGARISWATRRTLSSLS